MLGKANSSLRSHILKKKKEDSEKEKPEMDYAMIKGAWKIIKNSHAKRAVSQDTHVHLC